MLKYLKAIRDGKAANIAKMNNNYEEIFNELKNKNLINDWHGDLASVTLSAMGKAVLSQVENEQSN